MFLINGDWHRRYFYIPNKAMNTLRHFQILCASLSLRLRALPSLGKTRSLSVSMGNSKSPSLRALPAGFPFLPEEKPWSLRTSPPEPQASIPPCTYGDQRPRELLSSLSLLLQPRDLVASWVGAVNARLCRGFFLLFHLPPTPCLLKFPSVFHWSRPSCPTEEGTRDCHTCLQP